MRQYVVDAFAERVFEGNPAAVCLPERWPLEEEMQSIGGGSDAEDHPGEQPV